MLRDRARSAAILIPPVVVALLLGGPWIWFVVELAVLFAAIEAFRLLTAAGHPSFPTLGAVLALVVALGDSVKSVPGGSGLLLTSLGVVLVGVAALTRPDPREGVAAFATTTAGAIYIGLLGYVGILASAGPVPSPDNPLAWLGARAWVLLLVLAVWACDTTAYFVGRRFGSHPLMPHISPAKTVEGAAGGTAAAAIVAGALAVLFGKPVIAGLVLGLVIAVAAQAGDLVESMLKRAAGTKESGRLIPGHGGMLDRIDSLLFAAPAAFFYVVAFFR